MTMMMSFESGSTSHSDVDAVWRRRSWWTLLGRVRVSFSVRSFIRLLDLSLTPSSYCRRTHHICYAHMYNVQRRI